MEQTESFFVIFTLIHEVHGPFNQAELDRENKATGLADNGRDVLIRRESDIADFLADPAFTVILDGEVVA